MAGKWANRALGIGAATLVLSLVSGCSAKPTPTYTPHAGPVKVVTSVEVWANIAKQVGGSLVQVDSVIHSSMQDPHSYTATARDQLLVNSANVTLANGLGYDDFFVTLTKAAPNLDNRLRLHAWCVAACSTGSAAGGVNGVLGELTGNPHLWYHLASVQASVRHLSLDLERALPASESQKLASTSTKFEKALAALGALQREAKTETAGRSALLTEGFAAYLLADLGVKNLTPVEYRNAVENEQDASPSAMNRMHQLLTNHKISVLITNRQTQTAQTSQLQVWAKQAGVPVLRWSETLPKGMNYQHWMRTNVLTLRNAVTAE